MQSKSFMKIWLLNVGFERFTPINRPSFWISKGRLSMARQTPGDGTTATKVEAST